MGDIDYFKQGAKKRCVFGNCKTDSRRVSTPFLSFPKPCLAVRKGQENGGEQHRRQCSLCFKCHLWLSNCGRANYSKLSDVKAWHYICVLHFVNETGPTEDNPNPLPVAEVVQRRVKERARKRSLCDAVGQNEVPDPYVAVKKAKQHINNTMQVIDEPNICTETSTQTTNCFTTSIHTQTSENYFTRLKFENMDLKRKVTATNNLYVQSNKLQLVLTKENRRLKNENYKLQKSLRLNKNTSNERVPQFVNSLKSGETKCKFYTGLTFKNILALFAFLSPVENMTYWGCENAQSHNAKKKKFSQFTELIIMLVRLRTGLLVEDMSYRFNISTGYISKIVITWVQHCYHKFNVIRPLMIPTRRKIKEHLPAIFKDLKNIKIIIDCAEFSCESPSNFEQQGNLYSAYKATTIFKVLLGCTPNGAISFVSELFEGSISDKELVERSQLVTMLEDGDLVLTDRGFTISRLTNEHNISLNIPPFLKVRDKLTPEEEIATKKIAKQRIYIEHIVGKVKQFRLLQRRLPLNMRGVLSQVVFVCACIVNFQEPMIKK